MPKILKIIPIVFVLCIFSLYSENFWTKQDFPFNDTLNVVEFGKDFSIAVSSKQMYLLNSQKVWSKINFQFNLTYVYFVKISSNGYIFAVSLLDGVYRSKDKGTSWEKLAINGQYFGDIVEINNKLFLPAIGNDLFQSDDFGDNWYGIIKNTPLDGLVPLSFCNSPNNDLYFAAFPKGISTAGVYKSTNLGKNWSPITYQKGSYNKIAANSENEVFILTRNPNGVGIYKSDEEMSKFNTSNIGLDTTAISKIIISKNDEMFISSNGKATFYSNDYGKTWIKRIDGLENPSVNCFGIDSNNYIYAAGLKGGLYRSTNPLSTIKLKTKVYPDTVIKALAGDKISFEVNSKTDNDDIVPTAKIKIFDKLMDSTKVDFNDKNGVYNYSTTVPYNIPIGEYPIKFVVSKPGATNKDTVIRIVKIEKFVDVQENDLNSGIFVFPNPFDEKIVIENSKLFSNNFSFELIDQVGKVVPKEYYLINSGIDNKIILNNIKLAKGIYIAVINTGKESLKFKLIKN